MPRVSRSNRITLPVEAMRAAGLHCGDEVTVRVTGDGELVVKLAGARGEDQSGDAKEIYAAQELKRLRDEWER